ncbi:MAG: DUF166 family protein [Anaerolineae bacterium]|nr:hypothetical protein [Anaerolineae bacterium]MDW8099626.1 DUF166 family protein [Anaerolineae bacterium]
MLILTVIHGRYGQRIADNLKARAPDGWQINTLLAPWALPPIVDEPEKFLPPKLPAADLVLHLAEAPQAAQLLPAIVALTRARTVIAPLDHAAWIPPGLRGQLREELAALGVEIVFPEPFCSLTETESGMGCNVQRYDNDLIAEFARHFGRPQLRVVLTPDNETIAEVVVERGSPCGSTHYAAERLPGIAASQAVPRAGLICLHYPCLASMQPKATEQGVETLMHLSGCIFNQELARALDRAGVKSAQRPNWKPTDVR